MGTRIYDFFSGGSKQAQKIQGLSSPEASQQLIMDLFRETPFDGIAGVSGNKVWNAIKKTPSEHHATMFIESIRVPMFLTALEQH